MTIIGGFERSLFFAGTPFERERLTDGELAEKFRKRRELCQQYAKTQEALMREGIHALVLEEIADIHSRREESEEEVQRNRVFPRDAQFSFDFALYGRKDAIIVKYQAEMSPETRNEIERKRLEMIKGEKTLVGVEAMLKQGLGDYHGAWLQETPRWLEHPRNATNKGYLQDLLPRIEAVWRRDAVAEIEQRYGFELKTEARRIRTPQGQVEYRNVIVYHIK